MSIDKQVDCWTVSQAFRDHVKQYFLPKKYRLLEVGCYKGLTALSLADHFLEYLGVDNSVEYLEEAKNNNIANQNVRFQRLDIYQSSWSEIVFPADIVLIDALHEYEYIKQDIDNCLDAFADIYIIFDDYGAWDSVYRAVNEAIDAQKLELVQEIGMPQGQRLWADVSNPRSYTSFGSEGLLCRSL